MGFCLKILDAEGVLLYINPQGLDMLELGAVDPIAGRPYPELWPETNRWRIAAALREAAEGKIAIVEGYCKTFRGTPKWWETSFYSIRGADAKLHIVGISHDISHERRRQLDRAVAEEQMRHGIPA